MTQSSKNVLCSIQIVDIFSTSAVFMYRLLRILLERISMHLSSTLRISFVHPLHFFSTPFMTLTEKVLISSVDTLLVFVRVPPLLFLMASGSIYLIMMLQHSLSNPSRGTPGMYYVTPSLCPLILDVTLLMNSN